MASKCGVRSGREAPTGKCGMRSEEWRKKGGAGGEGRMENEERRVRSEE